LKPCYTALVGQLCTLKLARQYVTDSENHKLGTLIKHLKLPEHTAHSALGDVYMTHALLKHLAEMSGRSIWDIIKAQNTPKLVLKMPFGVHKGKTLGQLPKDYLEWLLSLPDLSIDMRYSVNKALELK
jgi:DNA polymerase III epsilon subunit-like protein